MPSPDAGSFRDPKGQVYIVEDRVFRTVTAVGAEDFELVRKTGLLDRLVKSGQLVDYQIVTTPPECLNLGEYEYLLEHPKLPYISYPYEWSFGQLKCAALFQLRVYEAALDFGVMLTDATAYNVQFVGVKPIFIDHLAFRPYREGEYWTAHRQFCEQFLNPLLLRAKTGVAHNSWYRGALEGISTLDLNTLLPLHKKLSWNAFSQVFLQAQFQKSFMNGSSRTQVAKTRKLPKTALVAILQSMRKWISTLEPHKNTRTVWGNYADDNSYSTPGMQQKKEFIKEFVSTCDAKTLLDIGCNTGDYSEVALESGAERVVGLDFDHDALESAFERAKQRDLNFLPLYFDAANPSPSQGWAEQERQGLNSRSDFDAVLSLALIHHLAIAKNVPLEQALDWLLQLAPAGVVEFVPKDDPMVQELLRHREDIFPNYTWNDFEFLLRARARVVKIERVTESHRKLVWYEQRI